MSPTVSSLVKKILLCLLPASLALAANTQVSTERPVINFSMPGFNPEGYRIWLVRGSEARYVDDNRIVIKELTLSTFSGTAEGKIDTLILSPTAEVHPSKSSILVTGPDTIRVINDQLEATGSNWRYEQKNPKNPLDHKISIAKNVRVTFQAEFKDILK